MNSTTYRNKTIPIGKRDIQYETLELPHKRSLLLRAHLPFRDKVYHYNEEVDTIVFQQRAFSNRQIMDEFLDRAFNGFLDTIYREHYYVTGTPRSYLKRLRPILRRKLKK